MAELANRVQNALDEARMMVLGAQILIGFGFRAFFEPGFVSLPMWARVSKLAALCLMIVSLALVILPSPFHRLVEGGEDSERIHRVATRAMSLALVPFAIALGLEALVTTVRVGITLPPALIVGASTAAAALLFWYAIPVWRSRPHAQENVMQVSDLHKKIQHALTEARMVLPGAQAMLGFQLAVPLMSAFQRLPRGGQLLHAGALLLTALTVVLLIAPAAYHRIAEQGEETERFHRIAGRFVVAALVPLALSMSCELAVITYQLTRSVGWATALGVSALALLLGAWFGVSFGALALNSLGRLVHTNA